MMGRDGKAMLSFSEFEKVLNNVKRFWDRLDEIYMATDGCFDIWTLTNGGCIDDVLTLIQRMFKDDEEWVNYWVYDLNWGLNYKSGCVRNADGSDIKLETLRDLYDFLIAK